jgi:hypothetical protein
MGGGVSKERIEQLKAEFLAEDRNKDGFISLEELKKYRQQLEGDSYNEAVVEADFKKFDKNNDGKLQLAEYLESQGVKPKAAAKEAMKPLSSFPKRPLEATPSTASPRKAAAQERENSARHSEGGSSLEQHVPVGRFKKPGDAIRKFRRASMVIIAVNRFSEPVTRRQRAMRRGKGKIWVQQLERTDSRKQLKQMFRKSVRESARRKSMNPDMRDALKIAQQAQQPGSIPEQQGAAQATAAEAAGSEECKQEFKQIQGGEGGGGGGVEGLKKMERRSSRRRSSGKNDLGGKSLVREGGGMLDTPKPRRRSSLGMSVQNVSQVQAADAAADTDVGGAMEGAPPQEQAPAETATATGTTPS